MSLRVLRPGVQDTLQDLGRPGHQHLGLGPGGAMDEVAHRWANLLTGNPPGAPALEIALAGPTLLFEEEALVALCGGDLSPVIEGSPVPLWRPVAVRAGARLAFGAPRTGARCTLAVGGGFRVPRILGSAGTHLAAGFGGCQGRSLRAGDVLETGPLPARLCPGLRAERQRRDLAFLGAGWYAPWFRETDFTRPALLGLVPGPAWHVLGEEGRRALQEGIFRVSPASDRMGLRLQGPPLGLERRGEMVSAGVAHGTLQLPPDGAPILLMADRQTTGGYPRLGEVATVDLPRAAQLRPGETLRFHLVSLEEAQGRYLAREAFRREMEDLLPRRLEA